MAHLLVLERHAWEKDIYVRDILEYFSVSDFCEERKTNTWQQREKERVSLSDAPWVGNSFRLLQNEIIGGVREGEIAGCENFLTNKTNSCMCQAVFFSLPKMNYTLPRQPRRASVPGSALRFLILRNDSTGCQTKHSTLRPKQSHGAQPRHSVILTHGRQTFLLLLEYELLDFCNRDSLNFCPDFRYVTSSLISWPGGHRVHEHKIQTLVFSLSKAAEMDDLMNW